MNLPLEARCCGNCLGREGAICDKTKKHVLAIQPACGFWDYNFRAERDHVGREDKNYATANRGRK